ncbi:hypothetical protein D2C87_01375 [Helicobacter pylori]|uniref:hypothetical protein n=1 Tax=Helicobacter pylori TaxID=210 RepID=UPI001179B1ED|nr:hypothetical protein [Helicobacter pylori]NHA17788.1 hypothetical protein [Helicobacter pylori]QEF20643.1 hypothetical protein D2C87_01375 [Helicobacter pylori]
MRPVGNALELKLCKIPTIGTQSENQTLPTGNISLGSPIVFSGWALQKKNFKLTKRLLLSCVFALKALSKGLVRSLTL